MLFGVSKYLFTALALGVVISLFASYFVAVSVVPLYCATLLKGVMRHGTAAEEANEPGENSKPAARQSWGARFHARFNVQIRTHAWDIYDRWVQKALDRPKEVVSASSAFLSLSFLLYPLVGLSFFPRTDAGQFVINVKAPTGTRIEVTEDYVKKVEDIVRQVVRPSD